MPPKKTWRKWKKGAGLTKKQALSVKKIIGNRQEHKFYADTSLCDGAISSAGTLLDYSALITQGDGDTNRDGDKLNLNKVSIKGTLGVADSTNRMRIIFFRWNNLGTTPTTSYLLEGGANTASDILRPFRIDTKHFYKVVYDRTFNLSTYRPTIDFKATIYGRRLGTKRVTYLGGGTTGMNHLYCYLVSDSDAATHPNATMNVIQHFTDS